ncbi:MAG: hypothetical protein IKI09_11555 [Bacteroidales bacterium]|nr:hypothetical protein [Bacteroidales bacterium]
MQAQDEITLVFLVNGFDSIELPVRQVYYVHEGTIVEKQTVHNTKQECVFHPKWKDYEEDLIMIRQNEATIASVQIKCLLDNEVGLTLPQMKIKLLSTSSHRYENQLIYLKNDSLKLLPHDDNLHSKQWLSRGYSFEELKSHFGYVKWYFPTELFIHPQTQYNRILQDSLYCRRMSRVFGHYPTDRELDSLAHAISKYDAEHFVGFCSFVLMELNEPILHENYGMGQNVFRLTWISKEMFYDYEPYSIRLEHTPSDNTIMYVSYQKWNECDEKEMYVNIVSMKKGDYEQFLRLMETTGFYNKTTIWEDEDLFDYSNMLILEANIDGQYHVIFRGDGEDEGMEELREFLWGLTGLGENKIVHRRQRIE